MDRIRLGLQAFWNTWMPYLEAEWVVEFLYIFHATIQPNVRSFLASSPVITEILKTESSLASLLDILLQIDAAHLYAMGLLYFVALILRSEEGLAMVLDTRFWLTNFLHWTLFIHFFTHSLFAICSGEWIRIGCIPVFCIYLHCCCRIICWYFKRVEELEAILMQQANRNQPQGRTPADRREE